jgi:hypothetical protein
MKTLNLLRAVSVFGLVLTGCGKSTDARQAAIEIEKAFANADAATKQNAVVVSQAMREGQFDQAVVSLTTIQAQRGTTPEQLQAIQNSSIALQDELIRRMEAGDEKAKAAYKLLQEMRRN